MTVKCPVPDAPGVPGCQKSDSAEIRKLLYHAPSCPDAKPAPAPEPKVKKLNPAVLDIYSPPNTATICKQGVPGCSGDGSYSKPHDGSVHMAFNRAQVAPEPQMGCEGHDSFDIECRVCRAYWPEKTEAAYRALRDEIAEIAALRTELATAKEEIAKAEDRIERWHGEAEDWEEKYIAERAAREKAEALVREREDLIVAMGNANGAWESTTWRTAREVRAAILAARKEGER